MLIKAPAHLHNDAARALALSSLVPRLEQSLVALVIVMYAPSWCGADDVAALGVQTIGRLHLGKPCNVLARPILALACIHVSMQINLCHVFFKHFCIYFVFSVRA
jgi:hypothetical protein